MTNSRLIAIGACIAVLAAVLASGVQRLMDPGLGSEKGQVMAAANDLPSGHRLGESDVMPGTGLIGSGPKAAMTDARQLVGRTLSAPLRKGQVIRQDSLAPKGSGNDIVGQLPPGHRALTVVLRDPAAASTLFPTALVDVLVTLDRGSGREAVTRTAIERVRVLALSDDARTSGPVDATTNAQRRVTSAARKVAVTLDVTPEQAAALELASSRGTVGLALRAEADTSTAGAQASTQDLLGPASGRATATSDGMSAQSRSGSTPAGGAGAGGRPVTWEVIVIRGDERVKHDFADRTAPAQP